jgi:hypothetical protein
MGPQKSRGLYRVSIGRSNRLRFRGRRRRHQPMAGTLGGRASQTDLRYHDEFL